MLREKIGTAKTCSRKCFKVYARKNWGRGLNNPNFKGDEYLHNGYYRVYHYYNEKKRNNAVHRLVYEKYIGRLLKREEVVHHKDGNKSNNKLENLELLSRSNHTKLHVLELLKRRWKNPSLQLKSISL